MIEFSGTYFDGKSSKANAVQAAFDGNDLRVASEGFEITHAFSSVEIEPPLGKATRVLRFANGAKLETDALVAIAELEARTGRNRALTVVNRLEGRWPLVLFSFVMLFAFTLAFLRFGLPWVADRAAFATPVSVLGPVTDRTLELLDGQYLRPSTLSDARQAQLEAVFARVTSTIGQGYSYRLMLRDSPVLGANAFALPNGAVVMTDDLVALSHNDAELEGVLAHEVGHVINRHALRGVYQGAGVFLVVSLIAGDFTGVTSLAASLPAVLIQNGYSQQFENEADAVAGRYMMGAMGTTKPLSEILERLTKDSLGGSLPSFLATHPGAAERARNLERIEKTKKP
jgi:Zn-dependent protease with chaperone function